MYKFNKENHIHILDGKPLIGTSSMSNVLAKPLTWWASGLACDKFGWINKGNKTKGWEKKENRLEISKKRRLVIEQMSDEQYLNLLDEAYSAHATRLKTSAKGGTDIHEVMENYINLCLKNKGKPILIETEDKKLKIFIDWSLKNVKKFLWSEMYCYSEKLWLGGISDCGYEDKEGKIVILDFKSSKAVYLSQFWQCIGYAIQIEENGGFTSEGEEIFKLDKPIDYVSVLPFGMKEPKVLSNFDMKGGKDAVKSMVLLYKKLN